MQLVLEKGYKVANSEIGRVYYDPNEIRIDDEAEIKLARAPWGDSFRFKNIKAI